MVNGIPKRIVCLTEESVETLYLLGMEELIVGVSAYVKRPQAAQKIPKVSVFTHAQIEKIISLKPDLVLGFSDIQKDIARELIGRGLDVWIANQRSLQEILEYIIRLASLVGKRSQGIELVSSFEKRVEEAQKMGSQMKFNPLVYIEEWDDPMITGIKWFSELVEVCGGENIFKQESDSSLASGRIIEWNMVLEKNPDIILTSWCGKKFDRSKFMERKSVASIRAIKENHLYDLESEIFLQPGPALFVDGIDILLKLLNLNK